MRTRPASSTPTGRISVHEDIDNDGVYEKHTRVRRQAGVPALRDAARPGRDPDDGVEPDEVWKYTDTNGDGVADKKELFTRASAASGNVEHQQSSLFWAMDNWMYSTYNAFRVRWTPNGVLESRPAPNSAQWGITQDNDGKIWFQGGASGVPGLLPVPDPLRRLQRAAATSSSPTFPSRVGRAGGIADMQGGIAAVRHAGRLTLSRVTGAAGNDIVRGASAAAGSQSATTSTASRSRRIVRRVRPVDDRRADAAPQRLSRGDRVHHVHRSAVPPRRHRDRARRHASTSSTCTAASSRRGTGRGRAATCARRSISTARQVIRNGRIWRLTLRRACARDSHAAADARRDAGAARRASGAPERLVARHRAAAARAEAGQVGRARAAADGPHVRQPARAVPRAVDARGPRRARRRARAASR